MSDRPRILVTEKIADAGIELLRERAEVDVRLDLSRQELLAAIGGYEALIIRSATKADAELIAAADSLQVIGRAGTGVDNVDVDAATRRGVLVCNAPQSNMLSAAEHALALMWSLARNIPQAHMALVQGRWERSRFGGVELAGKTLAVVGFGRIGQLVATRARGIGMKVTAYDPFVGEERFRDLGAARAASVEEAVGEADFVSLHLPAMAETKGIVNAGLIAKMKPGVRIINAARGSLVVADDLVAALDSGHVAGAALDVFESEPLTESPLFGRDNVVVTPHLGASTREAQDRAGTIIAEQVQAALAGGMVENAVNVPTVSDEDRKAIEPYVPLAEKLGRVIVALADGHVEQLDVSFSGGIAERDTRLLTLAVLNGALRGLDDEDVNYVNARALAESRGIQVVESKRPAGDYANLIRVATSSTVRISGTTIGRENRPWLVRALGHEVEIELAGKMLLLVNADRPGMIGGIGTALGESQVNIANMNVSRHRTDGRPALTAVQIDGALPEAARAKLAALDGITTLKVVDVD